MTAHAAMHGQGGCGTLLAFDTATERTSAALLARGRVSEVEGEGGARASAAFLPSVMKLLADADIAPAALDAIVFGRGPGAFTGLRIACSIAQGLALGADKPVLPIDTLLAIAEDARADAPALRVWALMDARMNEIYAAEYTHSPGGWQTCTAPMLTDVEALNRRWRDAEPEVVAGNALLAFADLETGGARRVPGATPRAAGMLALAPALLAAGAAVDAALALPLYLRDRVALTTAEREARAQV